MKLLKFARESHKQMANCIGDVKVESVQIRYRIEDGDYFLCGAKCGVFIFSLDIFYLFTKSK